ncbi:hypothetical protein L6452_03628 [Arctium lappa]|uniref:Uncharacterized protein n=1 Tax=Arctium lappa TaxID=4217 RepID=A0ACB9FMQ0_ARCLA|nr:hypothetical protein L6452_03628 [Arctium lappa]
MSPSGVQKERMVEEDMYMLSSNGDILFSPLPKPYPHKPPKFSDCAPLFMKLVQSFIFRITHMEMIKGIQGHGDYDELVVPIIENTAHERELTESLAAAKRTRKQLLCWSETMVFIYGAIPGSVPKLSFRKCQNLGHLHFPWSRELLVFGIWNSEMEAYMLRIPILIMIISSIVMKAMISWRAWVIFQLLEGKCLGDEFEKKCFREIYLHAYEILWVLPSFGCSCLALWLWDLGWRYKEEKGRGNRFFEFVL